MRGRKVPGRRNVCLPLDHIRHQRIRSSATAPPGRWEASMACSQTCACEEIVRVAEEMDEKSIGPCQHGPESLRRCPAARGEGGALLMILFLRGSRRSSLLLCVPAGRSRSSIFVSLCFGLFSTYSFCIWRTLVAGGAIRSYFSWRRALSGDSCLSTPRGFLRMSVGYTCGSWYSASW